VEEWSLFSKRVACFWDEGFVAILFFDKKAAFLIRTDKFIRDRSKQKERCISSVLSLSGYQILFFQVESCASLKNSGAVRVFETA